MHTLLRPSFAPEPWSAADLDAAADHWLWLFDRSQFTQHGEVEHRTEIRLRGFPRFAADGLRATLRERLPTYTLTMPDPDTVSAVGSPRRFDAAPTAGLGVPRLTGPPFDGLYAELRLHTRAVKPIGTELVDSALVLAGELTPTGFVLFTAWREGRSDLVNRALTGGSWPDEAAWRDDLARHRAGDTNDAESRPLADRLFLPVGSDRAADKWVWLVTMPPWGSDRRRGCLTRLAVNAAILTAGVLMVVLTPNVNLWVVGLKAFGLWLTCVPAYQFGKEFVRQWVHAKRFGTASFARMYADPTRVVPVDAATAAVVLDNPNGRKACAEWEAVGCRHAGDAVVEPLYKEGSVHRLYYAPDGVTHVSLCAMTRVVAGDGTVAQHIWPAQVGPLLLTRFPDGGKVATMTDTGGSFRWKLSGPEVAARIHHGLTDPAELLAKHDALVRRYRTATGHAPLPVLTVADFCRWQDEATQLERERYGPNPVTWGDAFVMLMGYTRAAYRPD